jgi:hypothetical protein
MGLPADASLIRFFGETRTGYAEIDRASQEKE